MVCGGMGMERSGGLVVMNSERQLADQGSCGLALALPHIQY